VLHIHSQHISEEVNLSWLIDLIFDPITDAPSKKRSGRSSNRATGRNRGSPNEQGERGEARVNLWASQELDSTSMT
jgi:hypothetical protein